MRQKCAECMVLLTTATGDKTKRTAALAAGLRCMLEQAMAVRIEVANARIRNIVPVMQIHGIEYLVPACVRVCIVTRIV